MKKLLIASLFFIFTHSFSAQEKPTMQTNNPSNRGEVNNVNPNSQTLKSDVKRSEIKSNRLDNKSRGSLKVDSIIPNSNGKNPSSVMPNSGENELYKGYKVYTEDNGRKYYLNDNGVKNYIQSEKK